MGARLQPAAAGQCDDVEGDGAEQQQGQNPPAALAGQAAAQHVVGGGAERRNEGHRWRRRRVAPRARTPRLKEEAAPAKTRPGASGGGAAHGPHLDSGDSERAAPTCQVTRAAELRPAPGSTPGWACLSLPPPAVPPDRR